MKVLTRFGVITIVLVVLYLVIKNAGMYDTILGYGSTIFSRFYSALTTGDQRAPK